MQRHRSRAARAILLATAFTVGACGAEFVEPNPPVLVSGERTFEDLPVAEPTVVVVLSDLHVPDPALCSEIRGLLADTLNQAAAAAGAPAMALPTVEVSPGCVQQPDRAFDPTPLADTIRSARAAFPGRVVRPLVLYANNVELALPPRIVNGLAQLRSDASQDGVEPWMYAVGLMDPAGTPFDRTVRWSHGTDPALWNGLRSLLDADLPFQSRRGGTFSAPLLDASLGAAGTLYRICSSSGGVRVSGCAAGPSAPCGLPPPPTATVTFTPVLALPGSVPPARAVVTYEACTVRCERFVDADGDLVPWTDLGGCSGARP